METQMGAHSAAVISRDGWGRQRCGSVPAWSATRRKQNRTKFGNVRKRGQVWDDSETPREARKLRIRKGGGKKRTELTRAQRRKRWREGVRTERWRRWLTVHQEDIIRKESHVTSGRRTKCPIPPPPRTGHLHRPPPYQTQHRMTEPCWPQSDAVNLPNSSVGKAVRF